MDVDRPRLARKVGAPDAFQQGVAGEDHSSVARQCGEQVELSRPQLEPARPHGRFTPARVDPEAADLDRATASTRRFGPPKDRLDPGNQRAGMERLGDVVVGAQLQADDRVDHVVARSEHHDRDIAPSAQLAAHLEAVQLGQHQVEDHQIWIVSGVEGEGLLAIGRGDHRPALLFEIEPEQLDDVALVVDHEDRLHPGEDTRADRDRYHWM